MLPQTLTVMGVVDRFLNSLQYLALRRYTKRWPKQLPNRLTLAETPVGLLGHEPLLLSPEKAHLNTFH